MTRRIMIDIETLSTHNTNAAVLSCAAVEWTMNKNGPIYLASRLWVPNLAEQFALGRTTMDNTIKWWGEQSAEAREHWVNPGPAACSLKELRDGLRDMFKLDKECEAWAFGIMFDLGNIASLYESVGEALPWFYRAPSDMRQMLRNNTKLRERPADLATGAAHDPVADCRTQIWGVWEHWQGDLPDAPQPVAEPVISDAALTQDASAWVVVGGSGEGPTS